MPVYYTNIGRKIILYLYVKTRIAKEIFQNIEHTVRLSLASQIKNVSRDMDSRTFLSYITKLGQFIYLPVRIYIQF